MAEWALSSVTEHVRLFTPSGSGGPTLTAGAANTMGSYVTLIDPIPAALTGLHIVISGSNGIARDFLIDIALGAAASETPIISSLLYSVGSDDGGYAYYVPITVPAGARLSARCQCSTASATCDIAAWGHTQGFAQAAPFSRVTTYGAVTAASGGTTIDPGATANTKGGYTQLDGATVNPMRAAIVAVGNIRNSNMVAQYDWLADIGFGAALSEVAIIPDLRFSCDTPSDNRFPCVFGPLPLSVPAATRLAAQAQCSAVDVTDRKFDLIIYGLD